MISMCTVFNIEASVQSKESGIQGQTMCDIKEKGSFLCGHLRDTGLTPGRATNQKKAA